VPDVAALGRAVFKDRRDERGAVFGAEPVFRKDLCRISVGDIARFLYQDRCRVTIGGEGQR
jgi:hypothetical protein